MFGRFQLRCKQKDTCIEESDMIPRARLLLLDKARAVVWVQVRVRVRVEVPVQVRDRIRVEVRDTEPV